MQKRRFLKQVIWLKKTDLTAKITETENKIPIITGLATNSALTPVENKIPGVSSLIKRADYNIKISDIEKKFTDQNHTTKILLLQNSID